jgi:hypothetical protein
MASTRVLSIELEQWSTHPIGRITDERGRTVSFDGWVSLSAALEDACRPPGPERPLDDEPSS